jgi:hypothetical protein
VVKLRSSVALRKSKSYFAVSAARKPMKEPSLVVPMNGHSWMAYLSFRLILSEHVVGNLEQTIRSS